MYGHQPAPSRPGSAPARGTPRRRRWSRARPTKRPRRFRRVPGAANNANEQEERGVHRRDLDARDASDREGPPLPTPLIVVAAHDPNLRLRVPMGRDRRSRRCCPCLVLLCGARTGAPGPDGAGERGRRPWCGTARARPGHLSLSMGHGLPADAEPRVRGEGTRIGRHRRCGLGDPEAETCSRWPFRVARPPEARTRRYLIPGMGGKAPRPVLAG